MTGKPNFALLRVLVIDDEAFMRTLIVRILSEIGVADVVTARDGSEGLEKVQVVGDTPHIIICDLEMPQMDGFEFVRRLRRLEDEKLQDLPVLIVTGHAEPQNVYDAVDAGIHGYLVKPISRQSLESRIATAMTSDPIDPTKIKR